MNDLLELKCSLNRIINIAAIKKYAIFKPIDGKPYNLNIWVVRSNTQHAGKFDDIMCVFYHDGRINRFDTYPITADPSDLSLMTMKNKLGCAVAKPGQYRAAYQFGKHNGKYEALVQNRPITVIRDYNRDAVLDVELNSYFRVHEYTVGSSKVIDYYDDNNKLMFRENVGVFGCNIHRASAWKILESVGLYSEGCIVHQNPYKYNDFIDTVKKSMKYWGDRFTVTLITEWQLDSVSNNNISKTMINRA